MSHIIPVLLVSSIALAACDRGPRPIDFGQDACAHCRMTVSEPAYGSQLVTVRGRIYTFDSIECLAAYVIDSPVPADEVHSTWVPSFTNPDEWLSAEVAVYLRSPALRSPMGLNLSAYADTTTAESFKEEYGGDILSWSDVRTLVEQNWDLAIKADHVN